MYSLNRKINKKIKIFLTEGDKNSSLNRKINKKKIKIFLTERDKNRCNCGNNKHFQKLFIKQEN